MSVSPYTAGDEIAFMRGLYEAKRITALRHVIEITLWRARRFDASVDVRAVEREALALWERMAPAKG
jgi:hypothetical protein